MIECLSTDQMQYFISLVMSVVEFLPNGNVKISDVLWTFDSEKNLWCIMD